MDTGPLVTFLGVGAGVNVVGGGGSPLSISGTWPDDLVVGDAVSPFTPTVSGGTAPYSFSVIGTAPSGVSISPTTGARSGTPALEGPYSFTIRVTDAASSTADLAVSGTVTSDVNVLPLLSAGTPLGVEALWDGTPSLGNPLTSPSLQTVFFPGFNSSGVATTQRRELIAIGPKAKRWQTGDSTSVLAPDGNYVTLSERLILGATLAGGIPNSATLRSPKPICRMIYDDHRVVAGNLTLHWVGGHCYPKPGKPLACIKWRLVQNNVELTSGTVSDLVSRVLAGSNERIQCYEAVIDLDSVAGLSTTTDNGVFKIDWEAYPHVGEDNSDYALSSVLKSELETDRDQQNCTLWYRYNPGRVSAPMRAFISTGASGGTASTDIAVARANPYPTLAAALSGIVAAQGDVDGAIVHFASGTTNLTGSMPDTNVAHPTFCGGYTLSSDPDIGPTQPFVAGVHIRCHLADPPVAAVRMTRVADLAVEFNAGSAFQNGTTSASPLPVKSPVFVVRGCTLTRTTNTTVLLHSSQPRVSIYSSELGGNIGNSYVATSNGRWVALVGCTGTINTSLAFAAMIGTRLINSALTVGASNTATTNIVTAFNRLLNCSTSSALGFYAGVPSVNTPCTAFVVENLVETNSTSTSHHSSGFSKDGDTGSMMHFCLWHNTTTGLGPIGRPGFLYADTAATSFREHPFVSVVGNIFTRVAHKSDMFIAVASPGDTAAHIAADAGCAMIKNGCGFRHNISLVAPEFPMMNRTPYVMLAEGGPGTEVSSPHLTPGFVSNNGVFWNGSAATLGPGSTDRLPYRLTAGSPSWAKDAVPNSPLAFYPDGSTRPAAGSNVGAMETAP
jgi:hypothetical protein